AEFRSSLMTSTSSNGTEAADPPCLSRSPLIHPSFPSPVPRQHGTGGPSGWCPAAGYAIAPTAAVFGSVPALVTGPRCQPSPPGRRGVSRRRTFALLLPVRQLLPRPVPGEGEPGAVPIHGRRTDGSEFRPEVQDLFPCAVRSAKKGTVPLFAT